MIVFRYILLLLIALLPALDVSAAGKWTTLTNPGFINSVIRDGDFFWWASGNQIVRFDTLDGSWRLFSSEEAPAGAFGEPIAERDGVKWFVSGNGLRGCDGTSWVSRTPGELGEPDFRMDAARRLPDGRGLLGCYKSVPDFRIFDGKTLTTCLSVRDSTGTSPASDQDVWFTAYNQTFRFDGEKVVIYDPARTPTEATDIMVDHDGVKWLIEGKRIVSYDNTQWKVYDPIPELPGDRVYKMTVDQHNVKWFFSERGLLSFDGIIWRGHEAPADAGLNPYDSMVIDGTKNVWVGARHGIMKFDGSSWTLYTHPEVSALSDLVGPQVRTIIPDSSGRIWMAFDPNYLPGLYRQDGSEWKAYSFRNGPMYNGIGSIAVDRNNVKWIGYTACEGIQGFCRIDAGISRVEGSGWKDYSEADGLGYFPRAHSLVFDREGALWAGTEANGIARFNGNAWERYTFGTSLWVYSIAVDQNDAKWCAAGDKGLLRYDGKEWAVFDSSNGIKSRWVRAVAVDRDNIVWAGASNGLWRYDGTSWTRFSPSEDPADTVVTRIAVGPDNVKWIGTGKGNLASYDGHSFSHYPTGDGPFNAVHAIFIDEDNVKWIGATYGLFRFDGQTWKSYTEKDGLVTHPVTAIAKDHDGKMWIGTNGGISIFEPDVITAVEDHAVKPASITITGNHPNPFNPSTTISFTLPGPGKATLTIYDATGRKVRTLISGNLPAGAHSAVWDGRDERGKTVSSGVYLSRLESGKTAHTIKMLLMK